MQKIKQRFFDIAASGLLRQMEKSRSDGYSSVCAYRGRDGNKCAIGFLISDESYSSKIEGLSATSLAVVERVFESHRELIDSNPLSDYELHEIKVFLEQVQYVHDYIEIHSWRDEFKKIADKHGLEFTPQEW